MDKKKKKPKQIAALVCVGLLVLLYVVTLVVACLNFPGADRLFQAWSGSDCGASYSFMDLYVAVWKDEGQV